VALLSVAGTGLPLSNEDKQHLGNLVQRFTSPESGSDLSIDLGEIGPILGMNDSQRNALIGRLAERGIAKPGNQVIISGEYVALIRELQERQP